MCRSCAGPPAPLFGHTQLGSQLVRNAQDYLLSNSGCGCWQGHLSLLLLAVHPPGDLGLHVRCGAPVPKVAVQHGEGRDHRLCGAGTRCSLESLEGGGPHRSQNQRTDSRWTNGKATRWEHVPIHVCGASQQPSPALAVGSVTAGAGATGDLSHPESQSPPGLPAFSHQAPQLSWEACGVCCILKNAQLIPWVFLSSIF